MHRRRSTGVGRADEGPTTETWWASRHVRRLAVVRERRRPRPGERAAPLGPFSPGPTRAPLGPTGPDRVVHRDPKAVVGPAHAVGPGRCGASEPRGVSARRCPGPPLPVTVATPGPPAFALCPFSAHMFSAHMPTPRSRAPTMRSVEARDRGVGGAAGAARLTSASARGRSPVSRWRDRCAGRSGRCGSRQPDRGRRGRTGRRRWGGRGPGSHRRVSRRPACRR